MSSQLSEADHEAWLKGWRKVCPSVEYRMARPDPETVLHETETEASKHNRAESFAGKRVVKAENQFERQRERSSAGSGKLEVRRWPRVS